MSQGQAALAVYRRVLRVHRKMPPQLRLLGDQYVKDEFRRHKTAAPEHVKPFMAAWTDYAQMLEQQTQQGEGALGAPLNNEAMDALSAEQLGQLSVLREEATKLQQP